jgi:hypothetical protein
MSTQSIISTILVMLYVAFFLIYKDNSILTVEHMFELGLSEGLSKCKINPYDLKASEIQGKLRGYWRTKTGPIASVNTLAINSVYIDLVAAKRLGRLVGVEMCVNGLDRRNHEYTDLNYWMALPEVI